jgi:tRNA A58 N-methylase Trm61
MEKHGFGFIRTIETLSRPLVIRKNEQKIGIYHETSEERLHTGYLTFAHK